MSLFLNDLGLKYDADKASHVHNYLEYYNEFFPENIRLATRKFLEIGIHLGASLKMWEEFFPNAEVYGIDNNPERLFDSGRIKSFLADQGDVRSLRKVADRIGGDLDFILDDGSHDPDHQINSVKALFPYLSKNGVYFIEDIQDYNYLLDALSDYKPQIVRVATEGILCFDDNRIIVIRR